MPCLNGSLYSKFGVRMRTLVIRCSQFISIGFQWELYEKAVTIRRDMKWDDVSVFYELRSLILQCDDIQLLKDAGPNHRTISNDCWMCRSPGMSHAKINCWHCLFYILMPRWILKFGTNLWVSAKGPTIKSFTATLNWRHYSSLPSKTSLTCKFPSAHKFLLSVLCQVMALLETVH